MHSRLANAKTNRWIRQHFRLLTPMRGVVFSWNPMACYSNGRLVLTVNYWASILYHTIQTTEKKMNESRILAMVGYLECNLLDTQQ